MSRVMSLKTLILKTVELLEQGGAGQTGVSIFALHMPDTVREGVLVRNSLNPIRIDYDLPGYRANGRVMVVCRSASFERVFDLAAKAMEALTVADRSMGEIYINYMRPQAEPLVYPASQAGSYEAVVNFDLNYVIV